MTTFAELPPHAKSKLSIASDALMLVLDFQKMIVDSSKTNKTSEFRHHTSALMKLAATFELPIIFSAVPGGDGKVSPLIDEVERGRGDTPIHVRTTANSMNDREIRAAIEASGRKTIIIAGVVTELAVQLPALTLAAEGYDVHVIIDACSGFGERSEQAATERMTQAGVKISSVPTLFGELAGDFVQPRSQQAMGILFDMAHA